MGIEPYIGQIIMFAGTFAPTDWAECDGRLLPIMQYQALFSLLGTTYGGDGRTNFALPDLRGRVPVGIGKAPDLQTNYQLGAKGGSETVTLTEAQMPLHAHSLGSLTLKVAKTRGQRVVPVQGDFIGISVGSDGNETAQYVASPAAGDQITLGGLSSTSGNTSDKGSSQPHNNLQPYLGIRYLIALQGIYPDRP